MLLADRTRGGGRPRLGDRRRPRATVSVVEPNTESILRLVWARALGLPDDALAAAGTTLVPTADHEDAPLRVLTLFDAVAMVGPARMLERIQTDSAGVLLVAPTLAALGPGARELSSEVLAYRDHHEEDDADPSEDHAGPLVSHDAADLAALLARCPADDVNDADLRGLEMSFTMLDDDHRPLAAAAYRVEHGLVADIRAITDPALRGRGHARLLVSLLADDAWDSGLIAQSRHHRSSVAGAALAAAAGFTAAGTLTVLG